jgi:hypothetical protein
MKSKHDVLKIDVFNFEDNFFNDKSVIVKCILELDNEYIIKAIIDNDCTDYSFIDIDVAQRVCEVLEISFLYMNKSCEVKKYDEKRTTNITHVIYSFMMITKLDQHSIILKKS